MVVYCSDGDGERLHGGHIAGGVTHVQVHRIHDLEVAELCVGLIAVEYG